jgi:hypothetical protein
MSELTPNLGIHDKEWFEVMSKLRGGTVEENLRSVVSFYVRRNKDAYKEILDHTANRLGFTPDELFEQLANGATLESLQPKNAPDIA